MQLNVRLLATLAPKIFISAGYILNRTLNERLGWKTPYEIVYGRQLIVSHMVAYGSLAYVLNKRINAGRKLDSRAIIGYLVGYDLTNIFRIWIPSKDEVI